MPSLRERLVALLLEDESEPELKKSEAQALPVTPEVEEVAPNTCPKCGSAKLHNPIANVTRCQSCGWQKPISQPRGFSRADLFYGKLDAVKMKQSRQQQLNPPGFAQSLGRIMFGR